jgi:hypothetical protein
MKIQEKLSLIQQEFKAKKSRFNSFGKYNFRSAEDILEALKPINKKYKVYFTIEESVSEIGGLPIIHSTATMFDGDESVSAKAIVGVDLNQKGMQVPQQFGSASSYGKKYSLGNLLLIDDTADADATNTGGNKSKSNLTRNTVKPEINMSNIDQAKKFLASGGTIETLNEKYTIGSAILKILKNE